MRGTLRAWKVSTSVKAARGTQMDSGSTPDRSTQVNQRRVMLVSEVIAELQRFLNDMGDLPVVVHDGLGVPVDIVFWDEDDNDATVIAIGT